MALTEPEWWRPYAPRADREAHLRSAVNLAKGVLSVAAGVRPARLHRALREAMWEYAEADGKHACRYRSQGALAETSKNQLRLDHVTTCSHLARQMLAEPGRTGQIMATMIVCVVTDAEHKRLNAVPGTVEGWDRYRHAGVAAWDAAEQRWLIPPEGPRWRASAADRGAGPGGGDARRAVGSLGSDCTPGRAVPHTERTCRPVHHKIAQA